MLETILILFLVVAGVTAVMLPFMMLGYGAGYVSGRWKHLLGGVVREVDLLIEEGNTLAPVEIKSGSTVAPGMLAGLQRWTDLAGQDVQTPTLVYGGSEAYTRQGISVRPWFAV